MQGLGGAISADAIAQRHGDGPGDEPIPAVLGTGVGRSPSQNNPFVQECPVQPRQEGAPTANKREPMAVESGRGGQVRRRPQALKQVVPKVCVRASAEDEGVSQRLGKRARRLQRPCEKQS
eukprot:9014393-Alexandrium_andersonii.AAC.1